MRRGGTLVPVPAGKPRVLLAALLLRAGRPVSTDELTQALWDSAAPPSARVTLHNHMRRLRKSLAVGGAAVIETSPAGYLIRAAPGEIDVGQFEAALAAGRAAAQAGAWARAAAEFRAGLALWRGEPLAGVPSEALAAREVPRLAELRLQAIEARIEADLHLSRHAEVVAELRRVVAAEPLRERLHALLMLALYRDGQQAAALGAYQEARRVLLAELGAGPGPDLQRLQRQVLAGDPVLAAPARDLSRTGPAGGPAAPDPAPDPGQGPRPGQGARPRPEPGPRPGPRSGPGQGQRPDPAVRYSLPPDTAAFTGRSGELDRITAVVAATAAPGGVVAIRAVNGMPGVGKTALAVHAGHLLTARFPDRQLFVDLRGHTPGQAPLTPPDALAGLLGSVGVEPRSLPRDQDARAALWRDKMAGQRALVILDNAASSAQVLPLLPGSDTCLVLVTSRRHLADLPGAVVPVQLEALPPDQARDMFTRLAPRAAGGRSAQLAELARLAGFLPLAISLLARVYNRHPAWSLADLIAETRSGLLTMVAENDTVAAAFGLSWQYLPADQQDMFRLLGLYPGTGVDGFAAAALAGVLPGEAARLLDDLHREGLLTETGYRRYGMHDLIRLYAADQAASLPQRGRDQALGRLLDYYQHAAARARAVLARQPRARLAGQAPGPATPPAGPDLADGDQALAWARAERATMLACLDHVTRTGQHGRVVALTAGLAVVLRQDGPIGEAVTRHGVAVAAAGHLGDLPGRAGALNELGALLRLAADYPAAARALEEAAAVFAGLGDGLGQADALDNLGEALLMTGDYRRAEAAVTTALGIYRNLGSRLGQAAALRNLGGACLAKGDYTGAERFLAGALAIFRELDDRHGLANTLNNLAQVGLATGDEANLAVAVAVTQEALGLFRGIGSDLGEANTLLVMGMIGEAAGDYPQAARRLEESLVVFRGLSDRLGQANALFVLGTVRRAAGSLTAAAAAQQEALDIFRVIGDRGGQASALNEIGDLRLAAGDPAGAAGSHRAALRLAREMASLRDEAGALAGLARSALAGGDPAGAVTGLRRAHQIYEQIGAREAAGVAAELGALRPAVPGPALPGHAGG